jgi:hypothetical protein
MPKMKMIELSEPLGVIRTITLREPKYNDLIELDLPGAWVELPGGAGFFQVTPSVLAQWISRLSDIDTDFLGSLCLRDALALRSAVLGFFIEASAPVPAADAALVSSEERTTSWQ